MGSEGGGGLPAVGNRCGTVREPSKSVPMAYDPELTDSFGHTEGDHEFLAWCEHKSRMPSASGMTDLRLDDADRLLRLAGFVNASGRLLEREPQYDILSARPEEWAMLIDIARKRLSAQSTA
jgi:hypothetical protein